MLIYTGRFQPFHNGHISLVNKLRELYPEEVICIAIIKNVPIEEKNEFNKSVDTMLREERNPFNSEEVLNMVMKIINKRFPQNVVATLMPRASLETWPMITSMFDCKRVWVFTENEKSIDEWERKKIQFYADRGDETIRIAIQKEVEGKKIRELMKSNKSDALKELLPSEVYQQLMKAKY